MANCRFRLSRSMLMAFLLALLPAAAAGQNGEAVEAGTVEEIIGLMDRQMTFETRSSVARMLIITTCSRTCTTP